MTVQPFSVNATSEPEHFPLLEFPLDVARLILETSAWSHRKTAQSLCLVSKSVRNWTEHILYHTIVLDTLESFDLFLATIRSRTQPDFFARSVRWLCIGSFYYGEFSDRDDYDSPAIPQMHEILGACSNVKRFAHWQNDRPEAALPFLSEYAPDRSLTHLSLLDLQHGQRGVPSVTHLHIDFGLIVPIFDLMCLFPLFPSLTHIQLSGQGLESPGSALRFAYPPLLGGLPASLELLIINTDIENGSAKLQKDTSYQLSDQERKRVVWIAPHEEIPGYTLESEWGYSESCMDSWDLAESRRLRS